MKKLIFFLLSICLWANTSFVKDLIGEEKFKTYYELIKPILDEKDLIKTLEFLQNNGLLDIFFEKPRNIYPTFVLKNANPILEVKILYKTLNQLGYYYFYPTKIINKQNYTIMLEMNSRHFINPLLFIKTISQYGCSVTNIQKKENYTYTIDCKNAKLNAPKVINKTIRYINAKGVYFFDSNNFRTIKISTSKYDKWYPYIVLFDKNLNILNLIAKEIYQKNIIIDIPDECKYIKIKDNYSKKNIKRGIYIKGLQ